MCQNDIFYRTSATDALIHSISKKKGKVGYIAIKIDLEKAYDKLEWALRINMVLRINLSGKLIDLIMSCVSSISTSILLNGAPLELILSSRGIRQGDPLPLTLLHSAFNTLVSS